MAMGKMPGERQEELFIAASGVGALGRKRPNWFSRTTRAACAPRSSRTRWRPRLSPDRPQFRDSCDSASRGRPAAKRIIPQIRTPPTTLLIDLAGRG